MVSKRKLRSAEPFPGAQRPDVGTVCALCGRPVAAGPSADEHHLVPRSQGGRHKVLIHKVCHRKIHATITEKELARHYADWTALKAHPELARFVLWLANKPPVFNDRSRKPKRR